MLQAVTGVLQFFISYKKISGHSAKRGGSIVWGLEDPKTELH